MKQVSVSPPERQRPRESRDDRAPEFGALVPWEQGRLFARLFDDGGQDSGGYGASLNGIKASGDVAMIGALTEQLAPRMLVGSQWPLMAVFHLGRLGRINASIRREQGGWNVELHAEQDNTVHWLSGVRQQCEQRLAQSLRQPVSLYLAKST
ncbi:flagellar hook-length control protein FliK [Pseudomonas lactis]|uniref:type III secretion system HrpP C-terminal domain-containing protein n=1 Tax=Pseudomonas TaxID=286 RepID=UPI0006D3D453|nr:MULTISPECIES: type III secretion system HrpP C-terminal domain-containing protein [Pseudomonas]MBA1302235.1 flagellar hook-length control protein FliK [Pseudomonas carnis]MBA5958853.1 flagellar hook-length control protein FliK [Pseudomonas lactis]MBC6622330.1 flagellar hook-length control protein FliK [Pseudomonas sp.]MBH3468035.1 flagellar hook-length control protein FliK [Pseudomonas carnis]MBJ2199699.1 flagellar hook-length control protein FliK [Pseudomonas carnis]